MTVTPLPYVLGVAETMYSPWRDAAQRPNLSIRHVVLPAETGGAALRHRGGRTWILLDVDLTAAERKCALTHELVHLDRGSTTRCRFAPAAWDAVVVREEMRVDDEVARRLVPRQALLEFVGRMLDLGHSVGAVEVAEEFHVTKTIATVALQRAQADVARRTA